jgi:hypothetical protein
METIYWATVSSWRNHSLKLGFQLYRHLPSRQQLSRNGNPESRSTSLGVHAAPHPDSSSITIHDFLDQGEADTGSLNALGGKE